MPGMSLVEALKTLWEVRTDEVVVTAMGAAREWMAMGSHPLDFVHVPSSMGQAPSLGLGIALARPERRVVVCNGDGSMLMNLGALVTITAQAQKNLVLVVFDNGVYEVTGAQPTPGSPAGRADGRGVDFAALARGCGFESVHAFDEIEPWRSAVRNVLAADGPTFVWLRVAPMHHEPCGPRSPGPGRERAEAFAAALRGTD